MHTDADKAAASDTEVKKDETKTENKDKGEAKTEDKDKGEMSVENTNADTETVKTGEFDMLPIILGLGILAVGAAIAYVFYKKKAK